jgi:hypothetical protein
MYTMLVPLPKNYTGSSNSWLDVGADDGLTDLHPNGKEDQRLTHSILLFDVYARTSSEGLARRHGTAATDALFLEGPHLNLVLVSSTPPLQLPAQSLPQFSSDPKVSNPYL